MPPLAARLPGGRKPRLSRDEECVSLSVIGSYLREATPEFDPRTYGCHKLTELVEKTGQFEVDRNVTPA